MKRDVAAHVALCDICQRVKAEHQRLAGLLQPLQVLVWKWEEISMDFIVGLPRTKDGYDSIWVIVDRLTKVARFIPVKTTYTEQDWQSCTCPGLYVCMGCPRRLCQTEVLSSRLDFGRNYMSQWIQN